MLCCCKHSRSEVRVAGFYSTVQDVCELLYTMSIYPLRLGMEHLEFKKLITKFYALSAFYHFLNNLIYMRRVRYLFLICKNIY